MRGILELKRRTGRSFVICDGWNEHGFTDLVMILDPGFRCFEWCKRSYLFLDSRSKCFLDVIDITFSGLRLSLFLLLLTISLYMMYKSTL